MPSIAFTRPSQEPAKTVQALGLISEEADAKSALFFAMVTALSIPRSPVPSSLTAGAWYFFALRYDSLNNFCKVTVLRDTGDDITASNISSSTTTKTSLGTNTITHNTGVFFAADDASAAGSNDFGGAMDDIAIFQTKDDFGVLSDTDLAEVFQQRGPRLSIRRPRVLPSIPSPQT
jgi:hypothetical protein